MRLLIAQGPGFYGVNIRMVGEDQVETIIARMREMGVESGEPELDHVVEHTVTVIKETPDGLQPTSIILTRPVEADLSTGFDSGWWDQGEAILRDILS